MKIVKVNIQFKNNNINVISILGYSHIWLYIYIDFSKGYFITGYI